MTRNSESIRSNLEVRAKKRAYKEDSTSACSKASRGGNRHGRRSDRVVELMMDNVGGMLGEVVNIIHEVNLPG